MLTITGIFVSYIVLLCLLIAIIRRNPTILSVQETALAFGLKVTSGCLYGYIFLHQYQGDDTWYFHNESISEYQKLIHHPGQFFKDLLPLNFVPGSVSGWQFVEFYFMELEKWIMLKPLAVFNIFSRGNYYVNVVFFNCLVFWGHYWLYVLFNKEFPGKKKVFYIVLFLLPSALFWLSGIRADGWLLFFTGLLFIQFRIWLHQAKLSGLLLSVVSLLFILILREALLFLLVPALICWFVSIRFKRNPLIVFALFYFICLLIFFGSTLISSTRNLPAVIVNRQQAFIELDGKTRFHLDTLKPNTGSFFKVLPQAINNSLFRPYVWEARGVLQWAAAADTCLFLMLLLLCIYSNWKTTYVSINQPFLLTILFYSLSLCIFIGYTVPFPGAIVRYKIIAQVLLTSVLAGGIPWKSLFKLK